MKAVYEAAHGFEAHMLKDLLAQAGISAFVQGEYLQGAVGGLPLNALVRLLVDDADFERARALLDGWEAAAPGSLWEPDESGPAPSR